MRALCPNSICDGEDKAYLVDDCTPHLCDKCGTRWKTYDPQERIEEAFDILIPSTLPTEK